MASFMEVCLIPIDQRGRQIKEVPPIASGVVEAQDLERHGLDVRGAHILVDGERDDALGLAFCHREVARLVAESCRGRLEVDGQGIVNRGLDAEVPEVALQLVPTLELNDEGMEGVELVL